MFEEGDKINTKVESFILSGLKATATLRMP